ncbi:MAG: hypothetical protein R6V46_10085 [Desulfatiglandaceae bacterium]
MITITSALSMRRIANSIIPKYLTAPWPEADRQDGHFWATISGMITIAKVHIWDTGSACFNPPVEEGSGEAPQICKTSPEGDRSRIDYYKWKIVLLDLTLVVEVYRFHKQCFQKQKRQGQITLPHTAAVMK